ncbi:class I SAM-dependent methyltransferase [Raineyella fluvialis]|uniref:Methyltransferase domain-containing protein n=1 Tax=Raineyella fluvialis TaxID=2662261 RepID=A0A5Q2F6F2_9ACTN|nr:class I SAM-dependent methyltransferase [Raineyella fluvialis]QGF22552.1 methyltransferase domain-containing protein [Raineyella fluvialis]
MEQGSIDAFDSLASDYDAWYDRHTPEFAAELRAVQAMLDAPDGSSQPRAADRLEIGVGTGRFAAALGIRFGLEPAPRMAAYARDRGIATVIGVAEELPFADSAFAVTAFITSLCFVADPLRALREAHRVTRAEGSIVVAYLEPESEAGRRLLDEKADSPYYSTATLLSGREVERLLSSAGFVVEDACHLEAVAAGGAERPEPHPGRTGGLFCVIRARRSSTAQDGGSMAP